MDNRDRILNAAISTFARRGWASTTMADVAREAGKSRALIGYHFKNKDALLMACLEVVLNRLERFVTHGLRDWDGSCLHAAELSLGSICRWAVDDPCHVMLYTQYTLMGERLDGFDYDEVYQRRLGRVFRVAREAFAEEYGTEGVAAHRLSQVHLIGALSFSALTTPHLQRMTGQDLTIFDDVYVESMTQAAMSGLYILLEKTRCSDRENSPSARSTDSDSDEEPEPRGLTTRLSFGRKATALTPLALRKFGSRN